LFPLSLSLIAVGIVLLISSRYGAGISPDSVEYIATARQIKEGVGFFTYEGNPLIVHPPLYSLLLAFIDYIFHVDPLISAPNVQAFLFGAIAYLSALFFFKHFNSAIVFIATTFVLFSTPLLQVSCRVLSEPLFICFALIYLINCESYTAKKD